MHRALTRDPCLRGQDHTARSPQEHASSSSTIHATPDHTVSLVVNARSLMRAWHSAPFILHLPLQELHALGLLLHAWLFRI